MIEKIERLVNLIESTNDEEVKKSLRRLLHTWVEREGELRTNYPTPDSPDFLRAPFVPWDTTTSKRECTRCGLELHDVMSYSCPHADCPTGMGPIRC